MLLRQADGSPRPPVVAGKVCDDTEGGRGLVLLRAVDKWGVQPGPGGGRTVWFECKGGAERPEGASPAPGAGDAR